MQLWLATALLIACAGGAAVFIKLYRKNKKRRFLFLTAAAFILALALIVYAGLTFLLLGGV